MRTVAWLGVLVATSTAGDLALAHAMRRSGVKADFNPAGVIRAIAAACRQISLWMGLLLHAAAFGSFLVLLSWSDVSVVVPASALSYAAGAAGAKLALGEHVDRTRWLGVALITGGVALVLAG